MAEQVDSGFCFNIDPDEWPAVLTWLDENGITATPYVMLAEAVIAARTAVVSHREGLTKTVNDAVNDSFEIVEVFLHVRNETQAAQFKTRWC